MSDTKKSTLNSNEESCGGEGWNVAKFGGGNINNRESFLPKFQINKMKPTIRRKKVWEVQVVA